MRFLIVGAGIGGLTAAIALSRVGVEVEVYEHAPEIREVGAGITLASNALRALDVLGLAEELKPHSVSAMQGGLLQPDGRGLTSMASDEFSRRVGTVAVVHRADLQALLLRHVGPDRVHLGKRCIGIHHRQGGVTAEFHTGETVEADGLIGADGLRSTVRSHLFGNPAVHYAGYTAWRGVVKLPISETCFTETWGPGRRFGIVPMSQGRVYWFAVKNAREGEKDPAQGKKQTLSALFRGWHAPIETLISAAGEDSILRNDIYDMPPLPHYAQGHVALLGDAAHAMTPNLGQGACQAIEDSVVLAASLQRHAHIAPALMEYEQRRMVRTQKIAMWSRRIGMMAQLANPMLCGARDFIMRKTPASASRKQLEFLFGTEILTAEEETLLRGGPGKL